MMKFLIKTPTVENLEFGNVRISWCLNDHELDAPQWFELTYTRDNLKGLLTNFKESSCVTSLLLLQVVNESVCWLMKNDSIKEEEYSKYMTDYRCQFLEDNNTELKMFYDLILNNVKWPSIS